VTGEPIPVTKRTGDRYRPTSRHRGLLMRAERVAPTRCSRKLRMWPRRSARARRSRNWWTSFRLLRAGGIFTAVLTLLSEFWGRSRASRTP